LNDTHVSFVSKIEKEIERTIFWNCLDIQRGLLAVLDSIKENDLHGAFLKHGKPNGLAVYLPKETILKEITAKIKLSQHFYFDLVQELSNRTFYWHIGFWWNDQITWILSVLVC
jgi:hypothetical protein